MKTVTLLEENRDLIGHGTTGLTSWQGALFLADWCQHRPQLFKETKIIELGSGVGLLGMSLLKTMSPKSYTFTDCHFKVLNFLIYNLKANFPDERDSAKMASEYKVRLKETEFGPPMTIKEDRVSDTSYHFKFGSEGQEAVVKHLDWINFPSKQETKYDLILGSDIVYERGLLGPLSKVIRTLLVNSSSSEPMAYIACTERSYTTLDCFHTELDNVGLSYDIVHRGVYSPTESILNSDVPHQVTRLYKIRVDNNKGL